MCCRWLFVCLCLRSLDIPRPAPTDSRRRCAARAAALLCNRVRSHSSGAAASQLLKLCAQLAAAKPAGFISVIELVDLLVGPLRLTACASSAALRRQLWQATATLGRPSQRCGDRVRMRASGTHCRHGPRRRRRTLRCRRNGFRWRKRSGRRSRRSSTGTTKVPQACGAVCDVMHDMRRSRTNGTVRSIAGLWRCCACRLIVLHAHQRSGAAHTVAHGGACAQGWSTGAR